MHHTTRSSTDFDDSSQVVESLAISLEIRTKALFRFPPPFWVHVSEISFRIGAMRWRHTSQGLDHQQVDMVVRKLGWKISFGSGGTHNGWHECMFRIFPVIIGASALATTLLLGSFIWGFVSKKNKNRTATLAPLTDLYPRATHKPNTVVALREFAKPIPSSSPKVADYDNNAYFDTLVFDAEQGYAQVLAEARKHAVATHKKSPIATSPVKNPPVFNDANKHSWLPRSNSARRHFLEDMEAAMAQKDVGLHTRFKSSKSWKKLLFWKRSKTSNLFEFDLNGAVHSSCSTPLHYMFKSSKTRATVAPTTPINTSKRQPIPKRSTSGPLYTDGSPFTPTRNGRSYSGPLSASSTPSREGLIDSPYMPLKRPCSSPRLSTSPLYLS